MFKYDDALDTFGVHGVGGTMGALLTGVFAAPDINANLNTNLKDLVGKTLWLEQLKAIGLTLTLAIVGTTVIGFAIKALIGLRADKSIEETGLDESRARRGRLPRRRDGPPEPGRGGLRPGAGAAAVAGHAEVLVGPCAKRGNPTTLVCESRARRLCWRARLFFSPAIAQIRWRRRPSRRCGCG